MPLSVKTRSVDFSSEEVWDADAFSSRCRVGGARKNESQRVGRVDQHKKEGKAWAGERKMDFWGGQTRDDEALGERRLKMVLL